MDSNIYNDINNYFEVLSKEECLKKLANMHAQDTVYLFSELDLGNITQETLNTSIDAAQADYEAKIKEINEYYANSSGSSDDSGENNSSENDSSKNTSTSTSQSSTSTSTSKKTTSKNQKKSTSKKEVSKTNASEYITTYSSFSGCDMVAIFEFPISKTKAVSKVVGSLQSVTYSIHNEKIPVRCLGDMNMKNCVFGGRVIAGTMVFTVFNRHWLRDLVKEYLNKMGYADVHYLSDELPPLNVTFTMANEYGQDARLALYGVTFVNEGQVLSINDNYTENTFEYYAKDLDYFGAVATSSSKNSNRLARLKTLLNPKTDTTGKAVDSPKSTDTDSSDTKNDSSDTENEDTISNDIIKSIENAYNEIDQILDSNSQEDIIKQLGKIQYDIAFNLLIPKKESGELTESQTNKCMSYSREVYESKLKKIQKYYADKEVENKDDTSAKDDTKKDDEEANK